MTHPDPLTTTAAVLIVIAGVGLVARQGGVRPVPLVCGLLLAAGLSPARAGTALLIGASVGGELLNAGAPEIAAIAKQAHVQAIDVISQMLLLALAAGGTAAAVFWWSCFRPEPKDAAEKGG